MSDNPATKMPKSVLFLCGQNMIRSPMAEALTKHLFPNQIYADSAGVHAGSHDLFVPIVLKEVGIETYNHEPKALEHLDDGYFDLVVALTDEAYQAALELGDGFATEVEYWPMENPSSVMGSRDQILDAYRRVRDSIKEKILSRLKEKK